MERSHNSVCCRDSKSELKKTRTFIVDACRPHLANSLYVNELQGDISSILPRVKPASMEDNTNKFLNRLSLCLSLSLSVAICRFLSLSVALCLSVFRCLSVSLSLSLYLPLPVSLHFSLCVTLSLYISVYFSLSVCRLVFLSLCRSFTHTVTHFHSL